MANIPQFMINLVSNGFKSTIHKLVSQKRLEFVADEKVIYTDRNKVVHNTDLIGMANILMEKSGRQSELETYMGISNNTIVNMLIAEKNKLEAKNK